MITAAPTDADAFDQAVRRLAELLPRPNPAHGYRQILLAYDGSDGAKAALERVAAVATNESTVTVISVIPFESVGASPDPIKPELRDWQWNVLTEATALLAQRGIRAFIEAAAGNPALVIEEVARTLSADLVVLGRGHNRWWTPTLRGRSIRRAVLRMLACDALVVAAPGDAKTIEPTR
jgi:nucleotide-binding universal stress UspA family protein